MGNLERVATWGTQSTGQNTNNRKHNTIQKTKTISSRLNHPKTMLLTQVL